MLLLTQPKMLSALVAARDAAGVSSAHCPPGALPTDLLPSQAFPCCVTSQVEYFALVLPEFRILYQPILAASSFLSRTSTGAPDLVSYANLIRVHFMASSSGH